MRSNDTQETSSQGPEIVGVKRGDWENAPSSTSASRPSDPESPEAIRRDIAGTRGEMSETVDAIQEKLDRDTLVEQAKQAMGEVTERAVQEAKERAQEAIHEVTEMAKEAVREATVGKAEDMIGSATSSARDTSESIVETIRANPIPAAIAAVSLGWLFTKRANRDYYDASYFNKTYGYQDNRGAARTVSTAAQRVTDTVAESASQASDAIGDVANKAGERLSSAGDTLGHTANSAGRRSKDFGSTIMDTIVANPLPAAITGIGLGWLWMNRPSSEQHTYSSRGYGGASYQSSRQSSSGGIGAMAGQAQDKVEQFASQAQGTAEDLAGDASHHARRMQTGVEGMIQENPLMVGVVAAAVGAAVGMAIPSTSQENRLLGDTRQSFMEAAKETVQDVGEKVQKVAEETQNAAQKAASEQKLTT